MSHTHVPPSPPTTALDRRLLLASAGLGALASVALPGVAQAQGSTASLAPSVPAASNTAPSFEEAFRARALEVRTAASRANAARAVLAKPDNGDEARFANAIGSDTRGLPHDARGEVDPAAWRIFREALASGDPAAFEAVPLGGVRKFLNPTGSLAVSLVGLTPTQFAIPPAHRLDSAELAAEAVEVWWQSLLRDVPLSEFRDDTSNPEILAAADELDRLPSFTGSRVNGRVTPSSLFRANALYVDPSDPSGRTRRYVTIPGVLDGPVVSQFLLRDAPWGAQSIPAKIRSYAQTSNFHLNYDEWLAIQNGAAPRNPVVADANLRYITTGRDLAAYAHFLPASYQLAAQLALTGANAATPAFGGLYPASQPPLAASNPYLRSRTQTGGGSTFGQPWIQGAIGQAVSLAIRTAYYQKFWVHRSLRPEAYGGLAHHRLANGAAGYPLHESFLGSKALEKAKERYGSHLLSQVYPEGAPLHASYPGGATIIGAVQVTLLKAFLDTDRPFPGPVEPDPADPARLVPWRGPALTLGGELNKLAVNYGTGRNWAGIHWRSDLAASLALGEEVAIAILRDETATFREAFEGFRFTRFDGTEVTV